MDCETCSAATAALVNPVDGASYYAGDVIPVRWTLCKNSAEEGDRITVSLIAPNGDTIVLATDGRITLGGANVLVSGNLTAGTNTLRISVMHTDAGSASTSEVLHWDARIFINGGNAIPCDRTIGYTQGMTYDVRDLFLFLPFCDTSTVTFSLEDTTGSGTLDGTTLHITKPGTFRIKATIPYDENDLSVIPGEVTATLTVCAFTVIFDTNGGSAVACQYVNEGDTVSKPADPTKYGFLFDGWYLGNVLYDFDTPVTADIRLTAKWTPQSFTGFYLLMYSISIAETMHGSVHTSAKTASRGDTVTITVTPDSGYLLETLTVLDRNGVEIAVQRSGETYIFTMPGSQVEIRATFLEDNTMLNFFVDVAEDAYYYDAILWAVENGITSGTDDVHFTPDAPCTRAQIVTFLWRAAGEPVVNDAMQMDNVAENAYYAEAVRWALSCGITTGATETTFRPDDECTRAQAVVFLFRYAAICGMDTVTLQELVSGYADADSVPDYALPAMNWALAAGIVQGDGTNLMPNAGCTRGQIVTFLWRTLGK